MATESIALPRPGVAQRPVVEKLHDWVITVDHKRLGILYIIYALLFLAFGGIEATIIRIQLMRPHNDFVSPQVFNRMFTMHGTTMIFFVIMPVMFGFANYLIPLMIGARDMAFPRLNAFSFWMTAFGGLLLYFSFVGGDGLYGAGNAPDVGWFAYAPLTSTTFSRGHSTDFWILSLLVSGFGSVGTAINIIATVLSMRCPGMTLGKMPLLAWLNLTMAGLVILAVSPLTAAQLMLLVDRYFGGHFFDTQAGGSAVIWMHFFWIFGHPEIYVLVIPAFAFASEIIPVFSRKAIFGYPVMVAATVCIAFIGMSVWAHHMFTVGMGSAANTFFVLSTMAIAVPTGIKIFNWLATMWGGQIEFKTPMLFCVAFLFQFLIAGLTGIMLGAAPINWQLGNSYFVIAHFHYVIVVAIAYLTGLYRLRRSLPSVLSVWRPIAFMGGLSSLWLTVASPLAGLDHQFLTFHMVQHLLLMTISAPLILLGAPGITLLHSLPRSFVSGVLVPLLRYAPVRALGRIVTHPLLCWFASTVVVIGWHIPALFEIGMKSDLWHGIEHASFFAAGLLFWWPVVQPWPSVARWPRWGVPLYLFLAALPCDALSAFLTFCNRIVYAHYLSPAHRLFDVSALADQECAGALMWFCVTFAYLVPAAVVTIQILSPQRRVSQAEVV